MNSAIHVYYQSLADEITRLSAQWLLDDERVRLARDGVEISSEPPEHERRLEILNRYRNKMGLADL